MAFVCEPCRAQHHDDCVGAQACVCQHRAARAPTEPATGSPGE